MLNNQYRTWIEISQKAITHNYKTFRSLVNPKVKYLAVVKSNAYGHELIGFAKAQSKLGADFLGVDSITEAKSLRESGIKKPILVLGYTLPIHFGLAEKYKISLTISSAQGLTALIKSGKKVKIHLKLDTGMHRQGFFVNDLEKVCELLNQHSKILVEGVYTHFASAKKPDSHNETEKQILQFKQAVSIIRAAGFSPITHAAATAGTLNYPEAHFDMVRIGIGMYGLWPSPETQKVMEKKYPLLPALTWKSIISEAKWVEKGEKVGYDYTETLQMKSLLAVVPIGYWHGYWRAFSGKASVLAGGKRCKVVGRIAMDMIVIDITGVPKVKAGDEVVLIGKQGKEEISAGELAQLAGTTHYEVVTRLNPLIKKVYL
ncbi:MAG: alanine racemase [Candidatus Doudnabacteria bacterium]|nr:alanine racemase [Candidatus Doudnabacteria bacterium]